MNPACLRYPGSLPFLSLEKHPLRLGKEGRQTSQPSAFLQGVNSFQKRLRTRPIPHQGFGIPTIYCRGREREPRGHQAPGWALKEPARG